MAWERLHWERQVGQYVAAVLAASSPKARAADRNVELRARGALGLDLAGMHANLWVIDEPASEPKDEATSSEPVSLLRDRFRVVGE